MPTRTGVSEQIGPNNESKSSVNKAPVDSPSPVVDTTPPRRRRDSRLLRIVCVGDGVTGDGGLESSLKYPDVLELMLEARRGFGSTVVRNLAAPGATTAEILDRLKTDVLQEKPNIAIVLAGGGDALPESRISAEVTRANLRKIVSTFATNRIRLLMLTYHGLTLHAPSSSEGWHYCTNNNGHIAEIASAAGIPLLDMGPLMDYEAAVRPPEELVDPKDGVRLRPRGEIVYARAIFKKLAALGWLR